MDRTPDLRVTVRRDLCTITHVHRVLIVDDHADSLELLSAIVKGLGHEPTICSTLAEALTACSHGHYDLLISDLTLTDGTGEELMARSAHCFHGLAIAVSGHAYPDTIARVIAAGFFAFVTKPYAIELLEETITRALEPKRPDGAAVPIRPAGRLESPDRVSA